MDRQRVSERGGLKDVASQYTDDEHRHADYRVFAGQALREVTDDNDGDNDGDNDLAHAFDRYNWDSATGEPAAVSRYLCTF
ncbi:hypothetical protein [Planotetraspora sp. GP83]|uniref:hypothetical protein n=1 Tax=Planotetraspora sp. GP83 TaxID=3156264 RepID=UPI00351352BD